MRLSYPLTALTVCSALLLSATASAQYKLEYNEWPQDRELTERQTWLTDRRYREGAGFRVGDFELHPGIGADFGYDSNFLRRNGSALDARVGSLILRVSPHFSVATLGPQRRDDGALPDVNFRLGVGATYYEYVPIEPDDPALDGVKDALVAQRDVSVDFKSTLGIMPGRPWSGRIYAGVARAVRPTNDPAAIYNSNGDITPQEDFNRILPQAGAELIWAPGGGMFDWHLGYNFSGRFFEFTDYGQLNNLRNEVTTRGRWRFLPRTALMFDARASFITFTEGGGNINKADSHPLRARIGVNGLITQSFAAMALVGWGASFYGNNDPNNVDFDSVIAQAEIQYFFNPSRTDTSIAQPTASMSSLKVGFIRDFDDAYIGTYFERDTAYARLSYLFGQSFLLVAEANGGAVIYPSMTLPDGSSGAGWTDTRLEAKLFGEYRFIDSVAATAEVGYTGYFSNTQLPTGEAGAALDPLGFQRFRAFLGARWFM